MASQLKATQVLHWVLIASSIAGSSSCESLSPHAHGQSTFLKSAKPSAIAVDRSRTSPTQLAFVGDVIFGRYRGDGFDPISDSPTADPFRDVRAALASDLVVVNLETPVIELLPERSPIHSQYRFGASRAHLGHLAALGPVVASLANNHFFDLREQGQLESPNVLRSLGITPVGASRTAYPLVQMESVQAGSINVGFVALSTRRNAPQFAGSPMLPFSELGDVPRHVVPLLPEHRSENDLLIVLIHWGEEYAEAPSEQTRQIAHQLIDAGADMVIGHHPHVLQGIEVYRGGIIAYSLGNFLFDNTGSIPRLTGVLRVTFAMGRINAVRFVPAVIERGGGPHPVLARGPLGLRVNSRLKRLSAALGTTWSNDSDEALSLDLE